MDLHLLTGSYRTWRDDYGVPVATSVGQRGLDARLGPYENLPELAPYGIFGNKKFEGDLDAQRQAYVRRLDVKSHTILAKLDALQEKYPDVPLVLLCWEVPRSECHRGWAAEWFETRHGLVVPEAHTVPRGTADTGRLPDDTPPLDPNQMPLFGEDT